MRYFKDLWNDLGGGLILVIVLILGFFGLMFREINNQGTFFRECKGIVIYRDSQIPYEINGKSVSNWTRHGEWICCEVNTDVP